MVCCECVDGGPGLRDRLEIRVRRGTTDVAFPALKRDQFAAGYDSVIDGKSTQLLHSHFSESVLLQVHKQLELLANDFLKLLCGFINYSDHEALEQCLKSEQDTPGVLRLLRYVPTIPKEESHGRTELAVDHTDIGLITVMPHSEAESLQILSQRFEWIDVERNQSSDTVVVIVGEQLAYLSNYRFQAVRHRVIPTKSQTSRHSMPFLMRAPAHFQLLQVDTGRAHAAKDVLNHVFQLYPWFQETASLALELVELYLRASSASNKPVRILASSLAQSTNQLPLNIQPLFIFFERKLPSSSSHKRFTKLVESCENRKPVHTATLPDAHLLRTADQKGWNTSEWASYDAQFCLCSLAGRKWCLILVPLESLDLVSPPDDMAWTTRSTVVLTGRASLESKFDLNSFRLN